MLHNNLEIYIKRRLPFLSKFDGLRLLFIGRSLVLERLRLVDSGHFELYAWIDVLIDVEISHSALHELLVVHGVALAGRGIRMAIL